MEEDVNMKEKKEIKLKPNLKMEKCIRCGIETLIPIDLNINLRSNYVEGAGQLCTDCFEIIYPK